MKVAIIGLSDSSHDDAPWDDPTWEKWGLPWDAGWWAQCDRLFEMHDRALLEKREAGRELEYFTSKLADVWQPLYMQEKHPDVPTSVEFPLEALQKTVFADYPRADQVDWYESSIAYMAALAIHEEADDIGFWGVDVKREDEFGIEAPCLNFLIGFAMGRGIKVHIPTGPSELCKKHQGEQRLSKLMVKYPTRYGWLK
jgi:hypothetical protein